MSLSVPTASITPPPTETMANVFGEFSTAGSRHLENHDDGREALTIAYLSVLGLCFILPVLYYFRLYCEERHHFYLRELENQAIRISFSEDPHQHHGGNTAQENRAARKKMREEKRARMLQLFDPVRMVSQCMNE